MVKIKQMNNAQYTIDPKCQLDTTFKDITTKILNDPIKFKSAYSDSELFCKRSDFSEDIDDGELNDIYQDYIKNCVIQKRVWKSSQLEVMRNSRCPTFDYLTLRCIILGECCKGKFGRVELLNEGWFAEGGIRSIYLDMIEELNDGDGYITATETADTFTNVDEYKIPNENMYLKSCNDIKKMNTFMERIKKFYKIAWDITMRNKVKRLIMEVSDKGHNEEWNERGGVKNVKYNDNIFYLEFNNDSEYMGTIEFDEWKVDNAYAIVGTYY